MSYTTEYPLSAYDERDDYDPCEDYTQDDYEAHRPDEAYLPYEAPDTSPPF
jgi:hypothetical protein